MADWAKVNWAEVYRIRWLKANNPLQYYIEKRERRRLKRKYIGFTAETRIYLEVILNEPCVYCGAKANTVDHVVPKSKGGSNHWWNLLGACSSCNNRKGNKSLDSFLEELWKEFTR